MSMPIVNQTHLRACLEQSILIALSSKGPSARHDMLLVIARICSRLPALLGPLRGFQFEAVQDVFTGLGLWIAHEGYDLMECNAEVLQNKAAKASEQAQPCSVLWYSNFVTMMLYRRRSDEFDLRDCISDHDKWSALRSYLAANAKVDEIQCIYLHQVLQDLLTVATDAVATLEELVEVVPILRARCRR